MSRDEIEYKFLASSAVLGEIENSRLIQSLSAGPIFRQTLVSTYYDTAALWFARRGLSLRVRWDGEKWTQTVKVRIMKQAGLFHRLEWEQPLSSEHPDLTRMNGDAAGISIPPEIIDGIKPLFETEFTRINIALAAPSRNGAGGECARIAVALDQGAIRACGHFEPISEVELELTSGPLEILSDVAQRLSESFDIRPGLLSKGNRGYQLLKTASANGFNEPAGTANG